jgi:Fe-S cluster biogenesis protein NfuA
MSLNKVELTRKIEEALESLRPFFIADGGDMELVNITDEGVAQVRLLGSCIDCSMSMMTVKGGVEQAVMRVAPEIVSVEAVNMVDTK